MRTLTRKTLFTIVAGLAINFLWLVFSSTPTFAASVDSLLPKVHFEGLYTCYEGGFLKSNLGSLSNYQDPFQSLINTNKNSSVPLITGHAGANSVKCSELVFGKDYDSWSYWHDGEVLDGIFPNYPVGYSSIGSGTVESPESEQKAFLKKVGYEEKSETMENGQCVRFRFTKNNSIYVESNPWDIPDDVLVYSSKICAELNSSGGVVPNSITIENNTTDDFIVFSLHDNSGGKFDSDYDAPYAIRMTYNAQGTLFGDDTATWFFYDYSSFDNIINYFLETITESGDFLTQREFSLSTTWYYLVVADPVEKTTTTTRNETYSLSNSTTAATTAMKNANSAYTAYGNLAFKPAEEFSLYTYYLNDFYKVTSVCNPDSHVQSAMGDNWVKVQLYDAGTSAINSNCYVEKPSNASTKVTGLNSSKHFGTEMDFNGVVTALNAIDPSTITEEDLSALPTVTPEGTPDDSGGDDGSTLAACYESAGVLGWIMCPVIDTTSEVVSGIYSLIENSFLEIESNLMSGSTRYQLLVDAGYTTEEIELIIDAGPTEIINKLVAKGYSREEAENAVASTGTREGWQFFRDFANYIFAILFIAVILSQVTGIGISNYGIKKALPRLIVVAVLVNLSFIACQLAVDLSNVLGNSLNELFVNVAEAIVDESNVFHYGNVVEQIGTNLLAGTTTVAATVGLAVVAANTWEFWLLPLILVLISGVIGILFFFIILGVRKAGVILLAIVAPIAIVCYALPNTKKIFDKWLKLFSSLLLVYPICGALMGGGKLASTLLLNAAGAGDTGFIFTLVAMLLTVVPFFFIPSILKSSMVAMGNLGAKISNFGSRLGNGATGMMRRSERIQDWNKRNQINTQNRRAQRLRARVEGRGGTLNARQKRRIDRAENAYLQQRLNDNAAINRVDNFNDKTIDNAIAAQNLKFRQQQYDEAESAILNGEATYIDDNGTTQIVNANDPASLKAGHAAAVRHFLKTGDVQAGIQARAYQQLMLAKGGGAGRDSVYTNMMRAVQAERSAQAAGTYTGAQAAERAQRLKDLGSHIASNDRWMGAYKASSPGAFSMFGDLAGAGDGISGVKDESQYQISRLGKVTQNAIPDMDDAWFADVSAAAQATATDYRNSAMTPEQLTKLDAVFSQAVNDPIIGTKIKDDANFAAMNAVHEAAYNTRVQQAIDNGEVSTRADFEAKYGAYQPLVLNKDANSISIPHNSATVSTNPSGGSTSGHGATPTQRPARSAAPIPNGATMTDSGIVIAPANMNGEQIRRYAEDMKRFNNSNEQNSNGQGPTIILPH